MWNNNIEKNWYDKEDIKKIADKNGRQYENIKR